MLATVATMLAALLDSPGHVIRVGLVTQRGAQLPGRLVTQLFVLGASLFHQGTLRGAAFVLDADDVIALGLGQARNRGEFFRAGLWIRINAWPRSCPGGACQQGDQQGGR